MSETANRWVSAFFTLGIGAFLLFHIDAVITAASGLVGAGLKLSQGIAGLQQPN